MKLSETQTAILAMAAQRADNVAIPLPERLRGGAAAKVVASMLAKGLLAEAEANVRAGEPVWRSTGDGHGVTLVATDAGLAAIGIEPAAAPQVAAQAPSPASGDDHASQPRKRAQRADSKQARLIEMLRSEDGVTLQEAVDALGWQAHTVRATISAAIVKKLGIAVTAEKEDGRGRVYRAA